MFSGAKITRPNITYPFELTWVTAKFSNKQHVRKSLCPTDILWVELISFNNSNVIYVKHNSNRKGQIRNIFWSLFASASYNLSPTREVMGQCDPSAFSGITIQGTKSKKIFCFQSLYGGYMYKIRKKNQEIWSAYLKF